MQLLQHISKDEVITCFKGGLACSQVVLMQCADELGYSEEEAARMAAAFGGGMFRGDTCGAVTGALIAIGLKYGHCCMDDVSAREQLMEKAAEFQQKYIDCCGSLCCRELIGYDFSKEEERQQALESGTLQTKCPELVLQALEILEEIL